MSQKIGRNDPCPCGSGKKYKKCCANTDDGIAEQEQKSHDGAVSRALDWLTSRHSKAIKTALAEIIYDGLSEEECDAINALDNSTWESVYLNATEWLLAEGYILVKGEYKRVSEILLGAGGPLFTVDQRNWIAQLSARPLRLYSVTDVIPGQQMTLCDELDTKALPIIVQEKSGSNPSLLGLNIGFRIMEVDHHFELSGAAYPFSQLGSQEIAEHLRSVNAEVGENRNDPQEFLSIIIFRKWLDQYIEPMKIPTIIDNYSGETMLLITDYYDVKDWNALSNALEAQNDVDGNRDTGWHRIINCEDGQTRSSAAINIEKKPDKISVFYKTQKFADEGRFWFDAIAGNAVKYIAREMSDPASIIKSSPKTGKTKPEQTDPAISPKNQIQVLEQAYHRSYANWADEPLPKLDGKTPRQAIQTPAGLERVKGLLRMYEANEREFAVQQGRREISLEFLWKALGISR